MLVKFIKTWGAELALFVLVSAFISLAVAVPTLGDKFSQALISSVSAYIAYLAFRITRDNATRSAISQLESRSSHFRVIETIRDKDYRSKFVWLRLQNGGGTMILQGPWYKSLNDQLTYGLTFAMQEMAEIFPAQGFVPYSSMGGYPIYLAPNETVYLKLSSTGEPLGTGTNIDVELRFWDLNEGTFRVQYIKGNVMLGRIDTGPAISEK